jgi:cytochrome c2
VPGPTVHSRLGPARARFAVLAAAAAALLVLGGCDVAENADVERGRNLFVAECGTCHALAQAGTASEIGPDLDAAFARARADGMDNDTIEGVVEKQIAHPRIPNVPEGTEAYSEVYMPADLVEGQDAEDVATYVASVAGVPGAKPPALGTIEEVFAEKCGLCHALSKAGTTGQTGPDLDESLQGESRGFIREQIVDPNTEIAEGYGPDIMPQDFEEQLGSDVVDDLVDYILQSMRQ